MHISKRIITVLSSAALLLSLSACGSGSASSAAAASSAPAVQTVTGMAAGKNGDVAVEVSLEGNKITGITVTDQQETERVSDAALEEVPQRIVEANSFKADAVAGATITIQGKGIALEDLPYFFDRYYQGSLSDQKKSSGLDLSIAREIIQKENGTITAKSQLGKGTSFRGCFPAARHAPEEKSAG